jgi:hypothetical protein
MKKVHFIPGNVSRIIEIEAKPSKLARRFGYQDIRKFQTKSRGRVSPEKLAALQKAADAELWNRRK